MSPLLSSAGNGFVLKVVNKHCLEFSALKQVTETKQKQRIAPIAEIIRFSLSTGLSLIKS